MSKNQGLLTVIGVHLLILGFIEDVDRHKNIYLEQVFYYIKIGGEPIKMTCYNLMIPIRSRLNDGNLILRDTIFKQREITRLKENEIIFYLLLKIIKFCLLRGFIKKYLSSLELKLPNPKEVKKMDAVGVKKIRKINERKIAALVDTPNLNLKNLE